MWLILTSIAGLVFATPLRSVSASACHECSIACFGSFLFLTNMIGLMNFHVARGVLRTFDFWFITGNGIVAAAMSIAQQYGLANVPLYYSIISEKHFLFCVCGVGLLDAFHWARWFKWSAAVMGLGILTFRIVFVQMEPNSWNGVQLISQEFECQTYSIDSGPFLRSARLNLTIFLVKIIVSLSTTDAAVLLCRRIRFVKQSLPDGHDDVAEESSEEKLEEDKTRASLPPGSALDEASSWVPVHPCPVG